MIKPALILNGRGYLLADKVKEILPRKTAWPRRHNIALYNRQTKTKIYLYDMELVRRAYKPKKKNVFIPRFAKPLLKKILKDYSIYNLTEAELVKKYKLNRNSIIHYINSNLDPTKPKYQNIFDDE